MIDQLELKLFVPRFSNDNFPFSFIAMPPPMVFTGSKPGVPQDGCKRFSWGQIMQPPSERIEYAHFLEPNFHIFAFFLIRKISSKDEYQVHPFCLAPDDSMSFRF